MATTTISLLAFTTFCLFFLLTESHLLVSECPSGTPTCSHGKCLRRRGFDEEGNTVDETDCICEPNYHGRACTLLVKSEFSNSEIVSPRETSYFSLGDFDDSGDEIM